MTYEHKKQVIFFWNFLFVNIVVDQVDKDIDHNDNYFIDVYTKRPMNMLYLPLIDVARS
jgi:hypothetical protein